MPACPLFEIIPPDASAPIDRRALIDGYFAHKDAPTTRKSHLFDGRHENVYLTPEQVPMLAPLLEFATQHAAKTLHRRGIASPVQRVGHWFNAMPPGSRTSKHDHNDGDELLSGVYYVDVPDNSGDLLLYRDDIIARHRPQAGELVLFSPAVPHEVTENLSHQHRLSIGLNFLSFDH